MRNWVSPAKNQFSIEGSVVWIRLTQGRETCVDLEDWTMVSRYKWHAAKRRNCFYAETSDRKPKQLHCLILGIKGVDHKNGDGLINLKSNLRPATRAQNTANSRKRLNCSSPFKGVSWHNRSQAWMSYIRSNGKRFHLGQFDNAVSAARAYDKSRS